MELNIKLLKAAALATSKEETRYYLNGVSVQAGAQGVFLVATDGHRALVFRQAAECYGGEPINIIIPLNIITSIKLNRHVDIGELTQENENRWRLDYCGTSVIFSCIDGTFPDWRRIVPKETNGELAQFNPSYVGDMGKVAKALGQSPAAVVIAHNGGSPALITFGDDVDGFGVLMPTRANYRATVWDKAPAWA